jgi:serine/threonine protein kinase
LRLLGNSRGVGSEKICPQNVGGAAAGSMNVAQSDISVQQSVSRPLYAAGATIAGRYKIVRSLGQGGMASVYLAEDLVLGKAEVAIKVLKGHAKDKERAELTERFIREVQLTHRINHQHVVRTFDFGRDGETVYYTMEYLPGHTLEQLIRPGGCEVNLLLRYAAQIVRGLAAIHSVGVIHRDLKPANIIVSDTGTLKITDFGVARSSSSQATMASSQVLGTIAYISPELLQGTAATKAADYYALGVILYELLAGQTPFNEDNPARMMLRKLQEDAPSVLELRPDTPTWLAEVIEGLLSRDLYEREQASQRLASAIATLPGVVPTVDKMRGGQDATLHMPSASSLHATKRLARGWGNTVAIRALFIVLCALIAIPIRSTDTWSKIEADHLDALFRLRGQRSPHPDIAVVAIDEQSYSQLKVPLTAPWPRSLHAQLLNALADAGAKRVVFDVLFTGADPDTSADQELSHSMTRVSTVLGAALGFTHKATINGAFLLEELLQPDPIFERESVGIGIVGLPQKFGRVRNFFESRSEVFPQLSSLAEMAVMLDRSTLARPGRRDLINFYGPAKTIPTVSYEMVLRNSDPQLLREIFDSKIVFVGLGLRSSTGPSQRDAFMTPFDELTYGTELHATAASNLLQNDWIRQPPVWVQDISTAVVAGLIAATLVFGAGIEAVLLLAGLIFLSAAIQYLLFAFSIFVPIASGLLWGMCAGILIRVVVVPVGERSARRTA